MKRYQKSKNTRISMAASLAVCLINPSITVQAEDTFELAVRWDQTIATSKLAASVYVVNSPMMRRNSRIHAPVFKALKSLNVDYLRYMSYSTFPKLSVAELYPPKDGKTSWDFSLMDPLVLDIFKATEGHPVMMTFSTVPAWMLKGNMSVSYPEEPNAQLPIKPQGEEFVDKSAMQVADYYARLFSWYTQGGFTDELGKYHKSGYHFEIPWWEVGNEPEWELQLSIEDYTKLYDAVVTAIRNINPKTKFVGLSMSYSTPDKLEYFLDPKNHEPGIPIDMISYHTYAGGGPADGIEQWQYSFFRQADTFLSKVQFIENIKGRLSPHTRTAINEAGTILLDTNINPNPMPIDQTYWNISGGHFAYLYMKLSKQGIDALHMAQGVGFPGFFPELSMFNWTTGTPNARYWVLKLLKDNFEPGDALLETTVEDNKEHGIPWPLPVAAQAYRSESGARKVLLVNQHNAAKKVRVSNDFLGAKVHSVDLHTGDGPARASTINGGTIELSPLAVAVITLSGDS